MKWYGNIGFGIPVNENDIHTEVITDKPYKGDILENNLRWQQSDKIDDDLNITNKISVIANDFAYDNIGYMKYVELRGNKWKIVSATLQYPRILLTIGGVWNGD